MSGGFRFIQQARLALDTGASLVTLSRQVLEAIGYDLRTINNLESFGNASQIHTVPKVILTSFAIGPARQMNIEALCYSLPAEYGIDGVIGLNYLRRFKRVSLDFANGLLILE